MAKYTLYWKTGEREVVTGKTPAEAMTLAGYSGGAVAALDFYIAGIKVTHEWNKTIKNWEIKK